MNNPYRRKIAEYAKTLGICTQCFARPAKRGMLQCVYCIEACTRKRKAKLPAYRKYVNKNHARRKVQHKREELGTDKIFHAVSNLNKL